MNLQLHVRFDFSVGGIKKTLELGKAIPASRCANCKSIREVLSQKERMPKNLFQQNHKRRMKKI
jgi:hypothetical protein